MKNTKETQILQKVTLKEISAIFQINLSIPVLPSGTLLQYSVPVLCSGLRVIKDAVATLPVTREQGTSGSRHVCSGHKHSEHKRSRHKRSGRGHSGSKRKHPVVCTPLNMVYWPYGNTGNLLEYFAQGGKR